MQHVNGTRGRAVPALPEHTFKDSGITIKYRKVGPMTNQRLAQAVRKEMPPPAVPTVETELGTEENPADPAYERAYKEWEQRAAVELNERMMRYAALECDIPIDDRIRAEVARVRRHLKIAKAPFEDDPELDQDENDRICYVLHVACASSEDLREFGEAVRERSVPTEEAVQRHIATFPGDVPGETDL